MLKVRFNLRKVVAISCLIVTSILFSGCNNPANNPASVAEDSMEVLNNPVNTPPDSMEALTESYNNPVSAPPPVTKNSKKASTKSRNNFANNLTKDIRNIIPDEYVEILKELGFQVHGGNTPPNVEGCFLANALELVDKNFDRGVVFHKDMYLTFY